MTISLGMFTNDGNVALAEKLAEALDAMPSGLTVDEQYERVCSHIREDSAFCEAHSEWSDTDVREAIFSWLEAPEAITKTEAVGAIDIGATIHITVPTLDGDANAVLEERLDEIQDIIQVAIEAAIGVIDKRIGDASRHEWSGVEVRVLR